MKIEEYKKAIPESEILRICLGLFEKAGFTVWRNNVGQAEYFDNKGNNRIVKFGLVGLPDIVGYNDKGKAVFWEVKRYNKKPTKTQLNFIENAKEANCFAGWGTDADLYKKLFMGEENE